MNTKKKLTKIKNAWGQIKPTDFNFHDVERYFKNNDNTECFQVISKRTINDIDFHELFMFIDRTNSKIGQQYLFNKLLVIDLNYDFQKQEELINYFIQNEEIRIKTQLLLSKLDKNEAYYLPLLFQDEYIKKPKWFWIVQTLSICAILSLVLIFIIYYSQTYTSVFFDSDNKFPVSLLEQEKSLYL